MVNRQDADILAQYNLELGGFYNYYSIADSIGYFGWKFNYFMKYSMLKTLGRTKEPSDKYLKSTKTERM